LSETSQILYQTNQKNKKPSNDGFKNIIYFVNMIYIIPGMPPPIGGMAAGADSSG